MAYDQKLADTERELDRLTRINAELVKTVELMLKAINGTSSRISDREHAAWTIAIFNARKALSNAK